MVQSESVKAGVKAANPLLVHPQGVRSSRVAVDVNSVEHTQLGFYSQRELF
jgi:hypothetical protein